MENRNNPNMVNNEGNASAAFAENELELVTGGSVCESCFVYVIKKGDCLSVIAQRFDTTVKILCEINNIINPDLIYVGNKLLIPYKG